MLILEIFPWNAESNCKSKSIGVNSWVLMAGKYKVAQNEKWKKLVVGFSFYILKVWQILKCLSGTFHQSKPCGNLLFLKNFQSKSLSKVTLFVWHKLCYYWNSLSCIQHVVIVYILKQDRRKIWVLKNDEKKIWILLHNWKCRKISLISSIKVLLLYFDEMRNVM